MVGIEEREEQCRHTETLPGLYKRFLAKSKDMAGVAYSQDGIWRDGRSLGFVSHPFRVYCTTTPDFPLRYSEVPLGFPFSPGVRESRGVTGGETSVIIACQRCHPKICPVGMDRDATSVSVISHLFPTDSETATVIPLTSTSSAPSSA